MHLPLLVRLFGAAPYLAAVCMSGPSVAQETDVTVDMARIDGGTYVIGSDDGRKSARPRHTVELRPFEIDRYEVTNRDFAVFLNTLDFTARKDAPAGQVEPADLDGPDAERLTGDSAGRDEAYVELDDIDARIGLEEGRLAVQEGFEEHPAPESTWLGAQAYCKWRRARLPTEAEWEAAARGKGARVYPWGAEEPTRERANFGRARGETAPVGMHPEGATPEGIHGLAGNLAEWTSSLFRPYPYDATDGREDPDAAGERVTRGGDYVFDTQADQLTGYFREGFSRDPRRGHRHIGFRCARDVG